MNNFKMAWILACIFALAKSSPASVQIREKFSARVLDLTTPKFNCTPGVRDGACSYHGICQDQGNSCYCDKGFIDWPTLASTSLNSRCNYTQENMITVFVLQVIPFTSVPTAAGLFLMGQIGLAVAQFMTFWGGVVFICIVAVGCGWNLGSDKTKSEKSKESTAAGIGCCVGCIWASAFVAMWIYTAIITSNGSLTDRNGAPVPKIG